MLQLTADVQRSSRRVADLTVYLDRVLNSATKEFVCPHASTCEKSVRSNPDHDFYPGQLHHVGHKYDVTANGKPLRVAVIGKSYGHLGDSETGTKHCDLDERYNMIMSVSKGNVRGGALGKCRNQHMTGTTFLLRQIFDVGLEGAFDIDTEFVHLGRTPERTHLFEMFALLNVVLCSAVRKGSRRDHTTKEMISNCKSFLSAALKILQPNLVISQGVAPWLFEAGLCKQPDQKGIDAIEELDIDGSKALLLKFNHPSAPLSCWGNKPSDTYLLETVKPTVEKAMHRLLDA